MPSGTTEVIHDGLAIRIYIAGDLCMTMQCPEQVQLQTFIHHREGDYGWRQKIALVKVSNEIGVRIKAEIIFANSEALEFRFHDLLGYHTWQAAWQAAHRDDMT